MMYEDPDDWERWFAWYPVKCEYKKRGFQYINGTLTTYHKWVWLQHVYWRRMHYYAGDDIRYRTAAYHIKTLLTEKLG